MATIKSLKEEPFCNFRTLRGISAECSHHQMCFYKIYIHTHIHLLLIIITIMVHMHTPSFKIYFLLATSFRRHTQNCYIAMFSFWPWWARHHTHNHTHTYIQSTNVYFLFFHHCCCSFCGKCVCWVCIAAIYSQKVCNSIQHVVKENPFWWVFLWIYSIYTHEFHCYLWNTILVHKCGKQSKFLCFIC